MSGPAPTVTGPSVTARCMPRSRRRAWKGQPIFQTRSNPATAASVGMGRSMPRGTAMSWPWTKTSMSRLSGLVIGGVFRSGGRVTAQLVDIWDVGRAAWS